ncbi:MAG: secretin N-terminal domain-containing protein [bacterium]
MISVAKNIAVFVNELPKRVFETVVGIWNLFVICDLSFGILNHYPVWFRLDRVRIFHLTILICLLFFQNNVWSGTSEPTSFFYNLKRNQEGKFTQERINYSGKVILNLRGVSLKNTLQLLTNRLGKNFLMDPEINDRNLNTYLDNITPMEAFRAILEANNLGYRELDGNVIYITKADKLGKQTVVKNISCKYAKAEELQEILKSVVVSEFGTVISDQRTNTLIIKESPEVLAKMVKLIQELDRPIKQVYIQAEILEISSQDNTELGVEWLWKTANVKSISGQVGTDFGLRSDISLGENNAETSQKAPLPMGDGLGIGLLNSNITAVLHALSEVNNLNLLSRPRVTTMDNQQAVIEVGDQIPFKVLNEFGITSFEFKDATVQLLVKPHIIDSVFIMLEVAPKADFQNGTTADGTPIIATRKASTKVKVRNGQTIVIGGLIRDSETVTQRKVPLLGSIPVLGLLFKYKKTIKVKTELLVFITPFILEDEKTPNIFRQDLELKQKLQKKLK